MSIKVMSKVWSNSKQKGTSLIILLALADFANDDGICWPSVETLAKKARTSKRNAQYIIRQLVKDKEIIISENAGPSGVHFYTVIVGGEKIAPHISRDERQMKSTDNGDEIHFIPGVKPISSKPSLNHHINHQKDSRSNDRKPNLKDLIRKELAEHFSQKTGLEVPDPKTDKQRREAGTLWYSPIREMCEMGNWDILRSKIIMDRTIERMDGLTICSPNSIIKTARAIVAEAKIGKGDLRQKEYHEMTDKEFREMLRSGK